MKLYGSVFAAAACHAGDPPHRPPHVTLPAWMADNAPPGGFRVLWLGDPNVLLFDEPTASLDELAEERIYELVARLRQEKGLTVILVSHDLSIVHRSANLVLCLAKDRPCLGPPQEMLTPEMLGELYGAPPQYYQHRHDHLEAPPPPGPEPGPEQVRPELGPKQ